MNAGAAMASRISYGLAVSSQRRYRRRTLSRDGRAAGTHPDEEAGEGVPGKNSGLIRTLPARVQNDPKHLYHNTLRNRLESDDYDEYGNSLNERPSGLIRTLSARAKFGLG